MTPASAKGRTAPYVWFSYENLSLVSFDFLLWRLVARSDHGQTPEQQSESENLRMAAFLMAKNAKTEMTSYEEMYKQMVLCRGVDMYLTYLTELLRLVFSVKPEIMKSNEQVTYESILEHSTIDDLVGWLIEEKVTKLSHHGVAKLSEFEDRLV